LVGKGGKKDHTDRVTRGPREKNVKGKNCHNINRLNSHQQGQATGKKFLKGERRFWDKRKERVPIPEGLAKTKRREKKIQKRGKTKNWGEKKATKFLLQKKGWGETKHHHTPPAPPPQKPPLPPPPTPPSPPPQQSQPHPPPRATSSHHKTPPPLPNAAPNHPPD